MDVSPAVVLQAVTLVFVILAFGFGRGDKSAAKVEALSEKHEELVERVHRQDLAMKDMEARLRDHVGGGFATKADINALRDEIASFRAMFEPIAQQLGPNSVRR